MKNFIRKIPSGAVIFNEKGEVLLCKRISSKDFWHNKWEFPGGTIEFGEDPRQTAVRETKEETGVNIKLLSDYPMVLNYEHKDANEDYVCIAYPAKYLDGIINTEKDDGVSEAKWFKIDEINFNNCLPFTKEMLDAFKNYIN